MKLHLFKTLAIALLLMNSPFAWSSPAPGTLAWNMVKIDDLYDAFPRGLDQLAQPETKAQKLSAITAWREYNSASRKLVPTAVTSPESIARYQELYDQVEVQLALLETAASSENAQKCRDILAQIKLLKKTGHREFK